MPARPHRHHVVEAVAAVDVHRERYGPEPVRGIGVARVPLLLLKPPRRRLRVRLRVHVLGAVVDVPALAVHDVAENAALRQVEHQHLVLAIDAVLEHHAGDARLLARLHILPAFVDLQRSRHLHKRHLAVPHRTYTWFQMPIPAGAVVDHVHIRRIADCLPALGAGIADRFVSMSVLDHLPGPFHALRDQVADGGDLHAFDLHEPPYSGCSA